MDPDPPSALLSVCVLLICLLGSDGDINSCPCPEIPPRSLTEAPSQTCFQIDQSHRYKCISGYLRKAGTSNLIRCKQIGGGPPHWSPAVPSLECIPDPSRPTAKPQNDTVTRVVTDLHTDVPGDTTVITTVTAAASSSTQMSRTMSPSVSPEPDGTEPTSPGLQVSSGPSQAGNVGVTTDRPTSASAAIESVNNNNNNTADAHVSPLAAPTAIGCVSLAIICSLIGITFYCYRRSKREIPTGTPEERIAMNNDPSVH